MRPLFEPIVLIRLTVACKSCRRDVNLKSKTMFSFFFLTNIMDEYTVVFHLFCNTLHAPLSVIFLLTLLRQFTEFCKFKYLFQFQIFSFILLSALILKYLEPFIVSKVWTLRRYPGPRCHLRAPDQHH
jgi:hypothetical protein